MNKDMGVAVVTAPLLQDHSPPAAWTAEETVTAWQFVFTGIEAHIQDRMAMGDPASPETYLSIIRADVADVNRASERFVNSRWHDYRSQREQIERLEASNAAMLAALQSIAEYWNRDQNETAMANACWHAIETAEDAIAKADGRT